MSGPVSSADANPWRPVDSARIEARVVAEELAAASEVVTAADERAASALERYEDVVPGFYSDLARRNNLMVGGIVAGAAAIGGLVGAIKGMPGGTGGAGRLTGALVGAVVGGAFTGGPGIFFLKDPHTKKHSTFNLDSRYQRGWPQDVKDAFDERQATRDALKQDEYTDAKFLAGQLEAWDVGGRHVSGQSVADEVADVGTAFDHDGDGVIALGAGSPEMVRDADGGPVTSGTRELVALPEHLAAGDTSGDGKLDPAEATAAVTTEHIHWLRP